MKVIRDLSKISRNDVVLAGGKGASLGEMLSMGIPVPAGFVILAAAFEKFLEETDLNIEIDSILHLVNHKKYIRLKTLRRKSRRLFCRRIFQKT